AGPQPASPNLILQPPETFLSAQHFQNIENPRRRRLSGKRGAERLRGISKLYFIFGNVVTHDSLQFRGIPIGHYREARDQRRDISSRRSIKKNCGLRIECERTLGKQKLRSIQKLDQGFGTLFKARHGGTQFLPHRKIELAEKRIALWQIGQSLFERSQQILVARRADVMPVHIFEFDEIEAGG